MPLLMFQELLAASKVTTRVPQQTENNSRPPSVDLADDPGYAADSRPSSDKRRSSSEPRNESAVPRSQVSGEVRRSRSSELSPMQSANPAILGKDAAAQPAKELGNMGGMWATLAANDQLHAEATDQKGSCLPHWLPFKVIVMRINKQPLP